MYPNRLSPVVIAAALEACALEPESLNSERIEQRFGSYGIEVLSHTQDLRRTSLFSLEGKQKTCRTYAVVQFLDEASPRVAAAHADILAGQSIGATFKSGGWSIGKVTLFVGSLKIDDTQQAIAKLMHVQAAISIGIHAYQLVLEKDAQTIEYATIVEAHHPDYLSEQELRKLYGTTNNSRPNERDISDFSTLIMNMH